MRLITPQSLTLVVLVSLVSVLPSSVLNAANAASPSKSNKSVKLPSNKAGGGYSRIQDVSLGANGSFTGVMVDGQGHAVGKSRVVIKSGDRVVAETATDDAGRFQVHKLRGGVYEVSHSGGSSTSRVWSNGTAPKSASREARVVSGGSERHGQAGESLLSRLNAREVNGDRHDHEKGKKLRSEHGHGKKDKHKGNHHHGHCDYPHSTLN